MTDNVTKATQKFADTANKLDEARRLVEVEQSIPVLLDEIAELERGLKPLADALKTKRAQVKQFMIDSNLEQMGNDRFVVNLVSKVRRNLNVDAVQKAISKTQWNRILTYVDPNDGKRPKRAYTETTSVTLTIKPVSADTEVVETKSEVAS